MALNVLISRSDSAIVASSASRYPASAGSPASAASARLRSLVSGVLRSWAMLSETCFSPSFRPAMRVSMVLRFSDSRSNSSPAPVIGRRPDRSPPMMRRLASDTLSMRLSARRPTKYQISRPPSAIMPSANIRARLTTARKRSGSPRSRPTSTIIWLGRRDTSAIAACLRLADRRGLLRPTVAAVAPLRTLAVALVGKRRLGPADGFEHARLQALDIAGQDAAVGVGDQIEVGAGLAGAVLHHPHQHGQPALAVGAVEALHLLVDRLLRLRGQHARRQRRHVEDQQGRAEREQDEVERRQPRRGGPHYRGQAKGISHVCHPAFSI